MKTGSEWGKKTTDAKKWTQKRPVEGNVKKHLNGKLMKYHPIKKIG